MESNSKPGSERRANFRVQYPLEHRPVITIRGIQFSIIDICEIGVRFHNPEAIKLPGSI
jgi:hypothetical protein